jgi:hypothetical protein
MRCLQSHFDMVVQNTIPDTDLKSCLETSIWTPDVPLLRYIRFSHPGRNTQSKLICNLFPHYGRWTPFQVLKALVHTVVPHPPAHHFWHHVGFKLFHRTPADLYLDPNLLFIYFLQFYLVKLGCWWTLERIFLGSISPFVLSFIILPLRFSVWAGCFKNQNAHSTYKSEANWSGDTGQRTP